MTKPYPKVGVGIIVLKQSAQQTFIMLHQRKGKRGFGKGYWGSGGGHLELGESLLAGALRELAEEAGSDLKVKNVHFLGVMNFTQLPPVHYVDISFRADWVSGDPANTAPDETTEWQWFNVHDLPSPLFPPLINYVNALSTRQNFFDSCFEESRH